jgi:RHS repeat-associated protein
VQLRIGKNNYLYGPLYFNGLIDEVRISTGALYSSNFTPPGTLTASSSTKGLWKFDGQTTSDSSANSNNGSLNGGATYSNDVPAAGGGGSAENVTWTNAVGVSSNGNSLTATANGWTAGASSTRAIMSGDGYVQFTASETSSYRMMALSHGDANQSYEELDFAFYLGQNGYLYVYENNVPVYFAGFYATGDTLRIAVESGVVKYRRNGAVVYTSTATPTYPLLADASLSTAGSTINNVVLSGNLGSSASTVQWLVADHLGTPRMILDEWGNLAAMKRHDYLPFGEELLAPTGGRTAAQGYSGGDGVRQQFTSYERDLETNLDFAEARYYSGTQGRFTRPDPYNIISVMEAGRNRKERSQILNTYLAEPRNWNRYAYCINNPVNLSDPSGLVWLTRDSKEYIWIDDAEYEKNKGDYEGYAVANGAVITFQGGSDCPQCRGLASGDLVQLNESGELIKLDPNEALQVPIAPEKETYTAYSGGYGVFSMGGIQDSRNQLYATFGVGASWPNFSFSRMEGNGPVQPGVSLQFGVANGLAVNEAIDPFHPLNGFQREVGYGTPGIGIQGQVTLGPLKGTTANDWAHSPDNPRGKPFYTGRCPY